jgi:hypothetical protein
MLTSERMYWFLIIVVFSICVLILILSLRRRKNRIIRTPAALSRQILRHPERILIDVPLYTTTAEGIDPFNFLLETESILASIGELESRRQFLALYAELVESPTKDSLKGLTNFLFEEAPTIFKDTLSWDGKCNNAVHFLEYTHRIILFAEKGKSLKGLQESSKKKRKRSPKNLSGELQGTDAKIMHEWNELNSAAHRAISIIIENKSCLKKNSENVIPLSSLSLIEKDRLTHLIPFLIAATDVCRDAVLNSAHTK